MKRVATIFAAIAAAATLSACGGQKDAGRLQVALDGGGFNVRAGVESLPEGHPPLNNGHGRALPDGHPPVPGYSPGLPEGHPVCPAGKQLLERGPQGDWGRQGSVQELIST